MASSLASPMLRYPTLLSTSSPSTHSMIHCLIAWRAYLLTMSHNPLQNQPVLEQQCCSHAFEESTSVPLTFQDTPCIQAFE